MAIRVLFDELTIRGVGFRNRVMMSPMCQYTAGTDGRANDWHVVHYGSRAVGGVGLVMLEATAVESRGRISPNDLGLWDDSQIEPLARVVEFCHAYGAKVGIQLAHAGGKAWSATRGVGPERAVAPSARPFDADWQIPTALDSGGIAEVVASFRAATRRALTAGFDVVEIHGAHGYLISEFLSPLTNLRSDGYAGSHANRASFAVEVADAVREEWPADRPLFVRLSCEDYAEAGNHPADAAIYAGILKEHAVDLFDCSSGGVVPLGIGPIGVSPGYQVPYSAEVRRAASVLTAAVGVILSPEQADDVLGTGRADLIALGRALLRDPYWTLHAAGALGVDVEWPRQYRGARPRRPED